MTAFRGQSVADPRLGFATPSYNRPSSVGPRGGQLPASFQHLLEDWNVDGSLQVEAHDAVADNVPNPEFEQPTPGALYDVEVDAEAKEAEEYNIDGEALKLANAWGVKQWLRSPQGQETSVRDLLQRLSKRQRRLVSAVRAYHSPARPSWDEAAERAGAKTRREGRAWRAEIIQLAGSVVLYRDGGHRERAKERAKGDRAWQELAVALAVVGRSEKSETARNAAFLVAWRHFRKTA